eukprot:gene21135-28023_t
MDPVQVGQLKVSEDAVSESGSSTSEQTPACGGKSGMMEASVGPTGGSTREYKKEQESYDAMKCRDPKDPIRKNLQHCYDSPSYGSEAVGVPAAENENGIYGAKYEAAKQIGLVPPCVVVTDTVVFLSAAATDTVVTIGAVVTDAVVSPGVADTDAVVSPGVADTDTVVSPGVADTDAM